MDYKFSEVVKNESGDLRIIFANSARNTIEMSVDHFCKYLPHDDHMPRIRAVELSYAAAAVICKGYDWSPAA
ncbi:MAG: hypothetical protein DI626_11525 [Micavibrio aeruginosavorus]|uniref:Uncharacterized protein n=1 Tax=Micavibrio aeruginosavorus TaxID=349221 RepID=A0A2W4ZE43_9BACT|nr:MAG: hypothetical protein DI626_11525 [Micavibrio aeruginosavorus]